MKIVFFGTSDVGLPIVESLFTAHHIVAVVTSPDAPVGRKKIITPSPIATFSAMAGIPVLKPSAVKNNTEFLNQLKNYEADIFIVVSYGKILPLELLDIPPLKTINIHFSLLPKYRGASPIQFALLNGEQETGTTIFVLDALVDHGPIIAQRAIAIAPDDTFSTLAAKLSLLSADLLIEILPRYSNNSINLQQQDHNQATLTKLIAKEDGRIDWTETAQRIYNKYRAYKTWPGIWTTWGDQTLKILVCKPVHEHTPHALIIPCGNNTLLQILELQLEGKKPMSSRDFLNGHSNFNAQTLL